MPSKKSHKSRRSRRGRRGGSRSAPPPITRLPTMPVSNRGHFKCRFLQTTASASDSICYVNDVFNMLSTYASSTTYVSLATAFRLRNVRLFVASSNGQSASLQFIWLPDPLTTDIGGPGKVIEDICMGTAGGACIRTRPPRGSFQSNWIGNTSSSTPLFSWNTGSNSNFGTIDIEFDYALNNRGSNVDTVGFPSVATWTRISIAPTVGYMYVRSPDWTQTSGVPKYTPVGWPAAF